MKNIPQLFELTPALEIEQRIDCFRSELVKKGISYALIVHNVNLFYFTGTIQRGYLVLPAAESPVFVVQKDEHRAHIESPVKQVHISGSRELPGILSDLGLGADLRTGLEFESLTTTLFLKFQKLLGHTHFEDISQTILRLRSKKTDFEIEQIKKSGQFVDHIFSVAPNYIQTQMTEVELAAYLQAESRKVGHQEIVRMRGFDHELTNPHVLTAQSALIPSGGDIPLSGYGINPAIGQGASQRILEKHAPLLIDYAGGYNGYVTDETRTFVLGHLNDFWLKAYEVALEILDLFEQKARPGVVAGDLYAAAVKLVEQRHLADNFMGCGERRVKFIGHGIGLVINELPIIAQQRQEILEENMVVALEPKFLFPGQGAIGVEVDYIVQKDRLERVSKFPTDIIHV